MEHQLTAIRDQQKETWNKFSPGWKKWDEFTMQFLQPMGNAIIKDLNIETTDHVLDIACGTGEPGLTIAQIALQGKVTGTDLAEKMLDVARENALTQGINNYEAIVCDACELPFENSSFDKVSCRMGFMFFPDVQLASDEMYRVLKPGGRMATSVWGAPDKNPWITAIMSVINKNMQLPPPPQGAPGMFRCAGPTYIQHLMETSGFSEVKVQEVTGSLLYDDFDHLWQMMNDVAAPVVGALSKADDQMKHTIKEEVREHSGQYKTGKGLEMAFASLVISGTK